MIKLIYSLYINSFRAVWQATEIHAFALLNTIYTSLPLATLTPYLPTLFQILLKRLQESVKDTKVTKYARHLIVSLNVFVQAHGSATLIQVTCQ